MDVHQAANSTDSTDSGTEADISMREIGTEEEDGFGLKITNICTLAPSPQEEIDGFEMECEEIEEERHSDVQESDEESESFTDKIIIPRPKETTDIQAVPKTTVPQSVIYCYPPAAKAVKTTSSSESLCTVINSAGVASLVPQSVVQASMTSANSSTVLLQGAAHAAANGRLVVGQQNQIIQTPPTSLTEALQQARKKVSGIKFINVNPQTKEQKVLFVQTPLNATQTPSIRVSSSNSITLGQPASVVPATPKICVQTTQQALSTNSSATNLISLLASKVQPTNSATPPMNTAPKFIQILPPAPVRSPAPIRPQVTPVKTVGTVVASASGQPVLTTLPVSSLVTTAVQSATPTVQPVQNIVNGQLQLAFPIQQTGSLAGGKPIQQILLVANSVGGNPGTPVNVTSPANSGTPIRFFTPLNLNTQHSATVVANTVSSSQPVIQGQNSNSMLKNKCIPVIFAPVEANTPSVEAAAKSALIPQKSTVSSTAAGGSKPVGMARQSPLSLHAVRKTLNMGIPPGKVIYFTPGTSGIVSQSPANTQTTKTPVKRPLQTKIIVSPKKPISKVMVNKETNTENGSSDESKDRNVFPKQTDLEAKKRKLQRLKRNLAKKRKEEEEEEEEVNYNVWQDPENLRRSSRIRGKPQKSYTEKESDESLEEDEEEEEEIEKEVGGQGYEQFLAQLELEIKAATEGQEASSETIEMANVEKAVEVPDVSKKAQSTEASIPENKERNVRRKPKDEDPDFVMSGDDSDSDSEYKIEEQDEDDNDVDEDELPKWKRPSYKHKKIKPRSKAFPDVNLEDHTDKYSVEDKPVEGAPDRKMYTCKLCDFFSCISPSAMSFHISRHLSGKFSCPYCSYNDVTSSLPDHIAEAHPEKSKFKCSQCEKGFMTRDLYRKHMSKSHGEYIFSCEFCGKGFTYTRHLRKHLYKFHNGAGIFECSTCGKCFISEFFYDKHVKGKSCQKASCLCQECGAILANSKMLDEHRRRVHQKERNYMCNICNFTCYRMNQLKDHINIHTGDYPHKCPLCDFRAAKGYQVTSHMRTHTGKTPFKCDQCNYASRWNIQLRTHRPAHRSPHMVMCEPCGIAYKDERGLNLHKKKRHSETPSAAGDNGDKESDNEEEDDGAEDIDNGGDENMSDSVSNAPSESVENQDESSNSSKDSLDNSSEASTEMKDMKTDPEPSVSDDSADNLELKQTTQKSKANTTPMSGSDDSNDKHLSNMSEFSFKVI